MYCNLCNSNDNYKAIVFLCVIRRVYYDFLRSKSRCIDGVKNKGPKRRPPAPSPRSPKKSKGGWEVESWLFILLKRTRSTRQHVIFKLVGEKLLNNYVCEIKLDPFFKDLCPRRRQIKTKSARKAYVPK